MMLVFFVVAIFTIAYMVGRTIHYRIEYNRIINILRFDKSFDVELCSKEELISRCRELNFSEENTNLAVKFFIEKTKQSDIADELCIDEKSVQTRKRRLKQKLNTQM